MAKFTSLVLVVALVAVCAAQPGRLRSKQSRFLARQEVAEDVPAQTPYPPAGIKPEITFDLPNEQQEDEQESEPQQPDNTYLPPDSVVTPDETYGPPEVSGDDEAVEEIPEQQPEVEDAVDEEAVAEDENTQSGRLVLVKRSRKQSVRPAKLRAAKLRVLPVQQRFVAQPFVAQQLVAYRF